MVFLSTIGQAAAMVHMPHCKVVYKPRGSRRGSLLKHCLLTIAKCSRLSNPLEAVVSMRSPCTSSVLDEFFRSWCR